MDHEKIIQLKPRYQKKRLTIDRSLLLMEVTVYNLTNLKSCYNRQLANVGSIVEESVERNRKAIMLFTKIIPVFNHYICTGFGISEESYGGIEQKLAGTG